MEIDDFEWSPEKARANLAKHGVTFLEAASVFEDPGSIVVFDEDHSDSEERFIIIGYSVKERLLLVAHADGREGKIRLISARKATRKEREVYEGIE